MISVIIPIYNTEKYLKRCIDSIVNQTYKDLEIILVDDGSLDNSRLICEEYVKKDKRVKYYWKENDGQATARNYALDIAKGDWISFIDSDDWIELDMYETMIKAAKENDCDIAICGWFRNHGFKQVGQPCPNEQILYNNEELMENYLNNKYIDTAVWNKIYKKDLWKKVRFPKMRAREDVAILYYVLSLSKKAIHIADRKYIQYVRPGSTERSGFSLSKMDIIDITKEQQKFILEKYPNLYDYIALKPAKYCASLMEEILCSYKYKKYKKEYKILYNRLGKELKLKYSSNVKNSKDYKVLNEVLTHNKKFKIKSYISGVKILIIDFIKKFY